MKEKSLALPHKKATLRIGLEINYKILEHFEVEMAFCFPLILVLEL